MPRYVARRPRADDDYGYEPPLLTTIEVFDTGDRPTGLLDQDGNEIWCVRDPIGFRIGD